MTFAKRRPHADAATMGRGGMMLARGLMRGLGRGMGQGGPFGRHGGPGRGFDGEDGGLGGGFGGGRGGHGGGRGRRMFGQGELRLLLLSLLTGDSRHGYDLIKAVEDLTGGAYAPSPGVVYPTLALLVDEGLIAESPGEGARKAFIATDAGHAEITTRSAEVEAITARLKTLADAARREASPSILRAMANLKLALKGRIFASGFDESLAHQIADILDEAARRIERL